MVWRIPRWFETSALRASVGWNKARRMVNAVKSRLAGLGLKQVRRVVVFVIGMSVLLLGLAMLVLPGPAIVVIPAGLAILGLEFRWARRWLQQAKSLVKDSTDDLRQGHRPWEIFRRWRARRTTLRERLRSMRRARKRGQPLASAPGVSPER